MDSLVTRALAMDPTLGWAWQIRGHLRLRRGDDPELAVTDFERALLLNGPRMPRTSCFNGIAMARLFGKRRTEAIGFSTRALADNPGAGWRHVNFVCIYRAEGDVMAKRQSLRIHTSLWDCLANPDRVCLHYVSKLCTMLDCHCVKAHLAERLLSSDGDTAWNDRSGRRGDPRATCAPRPQLPIVAVPTGRNEQPRGSHPRLRRLASVSREEAPRKLPCGHRRSRCRWRQRQYRRGPAPPV